MGEGWGTTSTTGAHVKKARRQTPDLPAETRASWTPGDDPRWQRVDGGWLHWEDDADAWVWIPDPSPAVEG